MCVRTHICVWSIFGNGNAIALIAPLLLLPRRRGRGLPNFIYVCFAFYSFFSSFSLFSGGGCQKIELYVCMNEDDGIEERKTETKTKIKREKRSSKTTRLRLQLINIAR